MPLAAAGVGFTVTLGLLFTLWALMCYTALLLLEVYQHVPADMGLGSLAARYLGRYGQWVTGFCMLFLLYALTAAYISGAGELLASSLNQWLDWQLPPAAGVLIFTLLGGAVVCIGTALVDLFNRFLFSAKIVFLVIMLALLMPHIHQVNLLTLPVGGGLLYVQPVYVQSSSGTQYPLLRKVLARLRRRATRDSVCESRALVGATSTRAGA